MTRKLTQAAVDRAAEDNAPGAQLYVAEAKGLRIVVVTRRHSTRQGGGRTAA